MSTRPAPENLLGIPQLARALGLHQATVNRHVASGKYAPSYTVDGRPLFTELDVELIKATRQEVR